MPDGIPNVDSTVIKLAEQYQACNVRSRALNEDRKVIRDNVDKLGIDPSAFTVALAMVRDKTPGERQDYSNSINRVLAALDGKEVDLFGEADIAARNKRAEKRAEREAEKTTPRAKADAKSDANPKSDPKRGGAGKGKGKGKDAAATDGKTAAEVAAEEQEKGGKMLDDKIADVKAAAVENNGENVAPKSQSQIAAEKRNAIGLN